MSCALSAAAKRSTTPPASSASAASGIAAAAATRAALERNCRRCMGDSRVGEIAELSPLRRAMQFVPRAAAVTIAKDGVKRNYVLPQTVARPEEKIRALHAIRLDSRCAPRLRGG